MRVGASVQTCRAKRSSWALWRGGGSGCAGLGRARRRTIHVRSFTIRCLGLLCRRSLACAVHSAWAHAGNAAGAAAGCRECGRGPLASGATHAQAETPPSVGASAQAVAVGGVALSGLRPRATAGPGRRPVVGRAARVATQGDIARSPTGLDHPPAVSASARADGGGRGQGVRPTPLVSRHRRAAWGGGACFFCSAAAQASTGDPR